MDSVLDNKLVVPPIHGLPVEILCDIFILSSPSEVAISHVCSHWREVALNLRPLWSELEITAPEYPSDKLRRRFEQYILRAKEHPISLTTDVSSNRFILSLIESHLSQMQSLEIPLSYIPALKSPAPTLQSLKMINNPWELMVILPNRLFQTQHPRLRALSLAHASISWDSALLQNLHELCLESVWIDCGKHFGLLDCLASMPTLNELALENVTFAFTDLRALCRQKYQSVHLPYLNSLRVFGGAHLCSLIVRHIKVSQALTLDFEIEVNGPDEREPLLDVIEFVSTAFHLPGAIRDYCGGRVMVQDGNHSVQHYCDPPMDLAIKCGPESAFGPALLAAAVGAFALEHMDLFCLDEDIRPWMATYGLGRLENVTRLEVPYCGYPLPILRALMNGLHKCPAGCSISSAPGVWLPDLQYLAIRLDHSYLWDNPCPFRGQTPSEAIQTCLQARRLAGFGIEDLDLSWWSTWWFTEEQEEELVEELKKLVSNVKFEIV